MTITASLKKSVEQRRDDQRRERRPLTRIAGGNPRRLSWMSSTEYTSSEALELLRARISQSGTDEASAKYRIQAIVDKLESIQAGNTQ